jgi:predicted kinase
MSGFPGTGKTYVSQRLAERTSIGIVNSDQVRKALSSSPDYSSEESQATHWVCHLMIRKLLQQSVNVIYDATNLRARYRAEAYNVAEEAGARLLTVWVTAPEDVIRSRLTEPEDDRYSDADWQVYRSFREQVDQSEYPPSSGQHPIVQVDTAEDLEPALKKILQIVES